MSGSGGAPTWMQTSISEVRHRRVQVSGARASDSTASSASATRARGGHDRRGIVGASACWQERAKTGDDRSGATAGRRPADTVAVKYFSGEAIRKDDEVDLSPGSAPDPGVVTMVIMAGTPEAAAWSAPDGGVLIKSSRLGLVLTTDPEHDPELVLVRRRLLRIFADFNGQDEHGRAWLNLARSLEDMAGHEALLLDGARVLLYVPDDLEVEANLVFDRAWLGVPDYTTIRYLDGLATDRIEWSHASRARSARRPRNTKDSTRRMTSRARP
jgi:hypothetical protein